MAFVVEDGTGLSNATSFVSVADAQTIIDDNGGSATFVDVPATAVLSLSILPTNGQTVTVNGRTYTFQTTLTNSDGNVAIGASVDVARSNLVKAINLTGVGGTDYAASMTVHSTVTASSSGSAVTVTARTAGTIGNAYAVSSTLTSPNAWSSSTLAGGKNMRELWLVKATRALCREYVGRWPGLILEETQALPFPREQAYDIEGRDISEQVPSVVEQATALLADEMSQGRDFDVTVTDTSVVEMTSVRLGPISESTKYLGGKSSAGTYDFRVVRGLMDQIVNRRTMERA